MGSFEGRIIRSVCEFDSFQFESRLGDVLTPIDIIIRKTMREQDSAENLQFLISFTRERRIKLQSDSQVRKWVFLSDDEFKCPLTKDSLTKSLSHSQLMASTVIL